MADEIVKGQALVNSHTFWGSILAAASGSGMTNTIVPFVSTILAAHGVADPAQVVNAIGIVGGFLWTLYGRYNASAPITGVLKGGA